jgi:two-component system cell cycle sensor histidine kinase/response regulator CckA
VSGAPAQSRPLVIVVDDALPVRLLASRILTDAGYDVLSAPDGGSAATLIQSLRAPPNVVITDLRMPVMGGEALGQWLMARYAEVPVIYMSGFVPETTGELPGVFLDKPFTPDVLLKAVAEALHPAPR